jgi:RNA polymerase sigma-70 factor, ECF subfamily
VLAELEERALVVRANRGDATAFDALYRAYRGWVVGVAQRLTGNPDDALDVLQETFVWFFGRFPGFRLTGSLRSFLYPVVKHQAISLLRRRRRVADRDPDPGWILPGEEDGDFARLLARLPPEQRDVVQLRFALDFQLDEIAAALAIPLGTVKSRLHHALRALRGE